jgi:hypothetical protein
VRESVSSTSGPAAAVLAVLAPGLDSWAWGGLGLGRARAAAAALAEDCTRRPPPLTPRMAPLLSGVVSDIRGRLPLYVDDWVQGCRSKKAPAATLFIFFLQLFPAVTFGFFLQQRTAIQGGAGGSYLGVIETLLSMGIGGTLFAFLAGQPLVVVGVTGPVALVCAMLHDLSLRFGLPFHGWLFWTCFWSALMHFSLAACNACDLIKRCTAFSGEVFGLLISLIYVYEGIVEFNAQFTDSTVPASAAVLSLLLGLLHLWTASTLASARRWAVLSKGLKSFLADYGPSLAIIFYTLLQFIPAFRDVAVPRLVVPSNFKPSMEREWIPLEAIRNTPLWGVFAAILPALVLTGLLFFDHNISSMLSQMPQFNLKKPPSYNWDFMLLGLSVLITGLLGLPPNYGLIPQAPLLVRSLAKITEVQVGTLKTEVWQGVSETRVPALGQSLLMLVMLTSPFLRALAAIPKGVLAGLFLHIGLSGLQGSSIMERLYFLLMDRARSAGTQAAWLGGQAARTPWSVVARFTLLQTALVAAIFLITLTPAGILFPVLIVLLVPCRLWLLPRLFDGASLAALDPLGQTAAEAAGGGATAGVAVTEVAVDVGQAGTPTKKIGAQ